MPDRMIKESVCSSEKVDQLSAFEETVFFRLILNVDDNGRIDARSSFLRSKLFLTKQGITIANIENAVHKMASIGLVEIYEVNDKPFLMFPKWHEHQKIRYIKDLYPAPPENTVSENSRKFPQISENYGKVPLEEKRSRSRREVEVNYCTELSIDNSMPQEADDVVIEKIPLNDKTEFDVTQSLFDEWVKLYPAVDIRQALRNMVGWSNANPAKKKTRGGVMRFINNWLMKEQDKGGNARISPSNMTRQVGADHSKGSNQAKWEKMAQEAMNNG